MILDHIGIREYVVSPTLVYTLPGPQYARRRKVLGIARPTDPNDNSEQVSWADMRRHKTLDSGISGAAAGGILRGWKCELSSLLIPT